MSVHKGVLARRIASSVVDWSIEVTGGILGSYFGVMTAALITAMNDGKAEEMQKSMLSGLGYGFIICTLFISFLNRVLLQGVSGASIGKKVLKLKLISTSHHLDWPTVIKRWLVSFVSLNAGGLGYLYLLFDSEGRTFHDLICHTDVVPIYEGISMSVESRIDSSKHAENLAYFTRSESFANRQIVLNPTLADVIQLRPAAAKTALNGAGEIESIQAIQPQVEAQTQVLVHDQTQAQAPSEVETKVEAGNESTKKKAA